MKLLILRLLCLVLCALFLFGCAPQGEKPSDGTGTNPSETSPSSGPTGELAQVPEAPVAFDWQTPVLTSSGRLWETETGYYYCSDAGLVYADKSDLSNWVIVCNKPECDHEQGDCPAKVGNGFYLKDGRIYSIRPTTPITPDADTAYAVYSVSADGSDDFRLEYPLKRMPVSQGGSVQICWRPDALYVTMSVMLADGTYENSVSRIDKDGEKLLKAIKTLDNPMQDGLFAALGTGNGDLVAWSSILAETETPPDWGYVVTKDGFEKLPNLEKNLSSAGCFKDGKLYQIVSNDGYYCTDLPTDQPVKWMDVQMKDSDALIFGTNCIVEHTMRRSRREPEPQVEPQMRFYNGTEWKAVAMPDKIWVEDTLAYNFWAVTSTHLFISVLNLDGEDLTDVIYMVDLTQDELKAVRCAEIR